MIFVCWEICVRAKLTYKDGRAGQLAHKKAPQPPHGAPRPGVDTRNPTHNSGTNEHCASTKLIGVLWFADRE